MTTAFGAGMFDYNASLASAKLASVFTAANRFVMIEGGAGTHIAFQPYLSTNSSTILPSVASGGQLLVQSAGWDVGT